VAGIDVTVSATGGSLDQSAGTTDAKGYLNITYTAPSVTANTQYTISAAASKTGYIIGSGNDLVTVTLPIDISPLIINITSPRNNSVNDTGYVNVTVTLKREGIVKYLNWNGVNHTMTPDTSQPAGKVFYKKMVGLLSGKYSLKVYANDTTGIQYQSETRNVDVNRTIVDATIGSFINATTFIVNKTIQITAPSGNVTITIPNGTRSSVNGARLTSISIDSLAQAKSTFVTNLGSSNTLIGENLSLGPEGALFEPDIQIRFNYTDAQLTAAE